MGKKSKQKGSRFELEIARAISGWWVPTTDWTTHRAEDLPFRRTPLSGGWDKRESASDLLAVSPETKDFLFSVEAKCREKWSLDNLLKKNARCPIFDWWKQCCDDAAALNKIPLLIFTKNFHPNYVCLTLDVWSKLGVVPTLALAEHGVGFGSLEMLTAVSKDVVIQALS